MIASAETTRGKGIETDPLNRSSTDPLLNGSVEDLDPIANDDRFLNLKPVPESQDEWSEVTSIKDVSVGDRLRSKKPSNVRFATVLRVTRGGLHIQYDSLRQLTRISEHLACEFDYKPMGGIIQEATNLIQELLGVDREEARNTFQNLGGLNNHQKREVFNRLSSVEGVEALGVEALGVDALGVEAPGVEAPGVETNIFDCIQVGDRVISASGQTGICIKKTLKPKFVSIKLNDGSVRRLEENEIEVMSFKIQAKLRPGLRIQYQHWHGELRLKCKNHKWYIDWFSKPGKGTRKIYGEPPTHAIAPEKFKVIGHE